MRWLSLRHLECAEWLPGRQLCLMTLSLLSLKADPNDAYRHPHTALPSSMLGLGRDPLGCPVILIDRLSARGRKLVCLVIQLSGPGPSRAYGSC